MYTAAQATGTMFIMVHLWPITLRRLYMAFCTAYVPVMLFIIGCYHAACTWVHGIRRIAINRGPRTEPSQILYRDTPRFVRSPRMFFKNAFNVLDVVLSAAWLVEEVMDITTDSLSLRAIRLFRNLFIHYVSKITICIPLTFPSPPLR